MYNVEFDESLVTGNEMIDEQHKELIGKIQDLLRSCEKGSEKATAVKMLNYLATYTDYHFKEEEKLQEQAIRGVPHKVAADCWFTSTGKMIPRMIKYEDTEGARHLLKDIEVLKSDKKHYAGILMYRYDCRAVVNNRMQNFILCYHPDNNTWDMIFPE